MLKPKPYLIIVLSDTIKSYAEHTAKGFRYPGRYRWMEEENAHVLEGRLFDPEDPKDREEFNKESMNHFRAAHSGCFPVPRLVTRMVESGFDAPEEVSVVIPAGQSIPEDAIRVEPVPPPPPPGPPTTPGARKKAHQLGVDIEQLRGQGTGAGGVITSDDVVRYWQTEGRKDEGPVPEAGPVRMSEILEQAP